MKNFTTKGTKFTKAGVGLIFALCYLLSAIPPASAQSNLFNAGQGVKIGTNTLTAPGGVLLFNGDPASGLGASDYAPNIGASITTNGFSYTTNSIATNWTSLVMSGSASNAANGTLSLQFGDWLDAATNADVGISFTNGEVMIFFQVGNFLEMDDATGNTNFANNSYGSFADINQIFGTNWVNVAGYGYFPATITGGSSNLVYDITTNAVATTNTLGQLAGSVQGLETTQALHTASISSLGTTQALNTASIAAIGSTQATVKATAEAALPANGGGGTNLVLAGTTSVSNLNVGASIVAPGATNTAPTNVVNVATADDRYRYVWRSGEQLGWANLAMNDGEVYGKSLGFVIQPTGTVLGINAVLQYSTNCTQLAGSNISCTVSMAQPFGATTMGGGVYLKVPFENCFLTNGGYFYYRINIGTNFSMGVGAAYTNQNNRLAPLYTGIAPATGTTILTNAAYTIRVKLLNNQ